MGGENGWVRKRKWEERCLDERKKKLLRIHSCSDLMVCLATTSDRFGLHM